jgi:hypothetical protein
MSAAHASRKSRSARDGSVEQEQAMNTVWRARSLALMSLAAAAVVIQGGAWAGDDPIVDHVRLANDRFKDVVAAVAEGYAPKGCVTSFDGSSMGMRYVNAAYLKDEPIDIKRPQAVLYEPLADGRLALAGVQFVTFNGQASLEGRTFEFIGRPNDYGLEAFYELPVWAWKANPHGAFVDMNPDLSCDHARATGEAPVIFDLD